MRPAPRNTLSDRVVTVARIGGLGLMLPTLVMIATIGFVGWFDAPVLTGVISALAGIVAFVWFVLARPKMMALRWRYELLEHELYLQQGIIILTRINIPYARIQNVDTAQGPIDRFFGVSSVTVSTAGGAAAIPILDDEIATQLRDRIDERVRAARGVVDAG